MKEVPKKDQPDVSGGVQTDGSVGGLVIPGMPAPSYPPGPCIPIPENPIYVPK